MRDLLRLGEDTDRTCADVDQIAEEHLQSIDHKIDDLQRLAAELRRISCQCQGGTIAECRILEALSP